MNNYIADENYSEAELDLDQRDEYQVIIDADTKKILYKIDFKLLDEKIENEYSKTTNIQLILDEVLGLVENQIIETEELKKLLELRRDTDVILTGTYLTDEICFMAAEVSKIESVKFKVWD